MTKRWRLNPASWSISTRLTVVLLLMGLVPMGTSAILNLRVSMEQIEAREHRALELLAMSTASRLDQLLIDHREVVVSLSQMAWIQTFLQQQALAPVQQQSYFTRQLRSFAKIHSDFDLLFLLNRQG
ncbi:MAG: hypothetical protein Q6I77_09065, partial [Gloeomargarita sp. DG_1_4_bins_134]